jgi:two-component system, NtrC family, sensor kinase
MSSQNTEKKQLLIVDDNPTNLGLLFDYLTKYSFKIFVALDGESAIEQVEYTRPDLILLDVMMPGIDGFETCERLKANPLIQDIPVIFMTALSDTVDKVRGFTVGAVDYITKPIQPEEVLSRIQTHLTLRNLHKQLQEQNECLLRSQTRERQRNRELEQALQQLQQTQTQLIHTEKMSCLGQMVAGISHEINNPINFIYGNLYLADEYSQELLELIHLYQETYTHPAAPIAAKLETTDLEFIKSDLPQLFKSMKVGAERISQTVLLLRNFSRLDEAQIKLVDIHEGIDSTLLLLQHRLGAAAKRAAIQVIKQYGNIPKVECYPSLLNQVFMNILSNAIDALEESLVSHQHSEFAPVSDRERLRESDKGQWATDKHPTIWICTEVIERASAKANQLSSEENYCDREPYVLIRIADNGPGMSEQISRRVFDPFFTTKPVGCGTGLGLTMSYQIVVENHKGLLRVNSELGRGSELIVELPLWQSDRFS